MEEILLAFYVPATFLVLPAGIFGIVGVTYNEDKNVIMTVTGGVSRMRCSGFFSRQAAVSWI